MTSKKSLFFLKNILDFYQKLHFTPYIINEGLKLELVSEKGLKIWKFLILNFILHAIYTGIQFIFNEDLMLKNTFLIPYLLMYFGSLIAVVLAYFYFYKNLPELFNKLFTLENLFKGNFIYFKLNKSLKLRI